MNEESAPARDLDIDNRLATGHFPSHPVLAVGVADRETGLAEELLKTNIPLGMCAELVHVVVEKPSQHHAVPNLLASQPHHVQQIEVVGLLLLPAAVALYRLVVAIQHGVDLFAF